jgi:hypothetical protein
MKLSGFSYFQPNVWRLSVSHNFHLPSLRHPLNGANGLAERLGEGWNGSKILQHAITHAGDFSRVCCRQGVFSSMSDGDADDPHPDEYRNACRVTKLRFGS